MSTFVLVYIFTIAVLDIALFLLFHAKYKYVNSSVFFSIERDIFFSLERDKRVLARLSRYRGSVPNLLNVAVYPDIVLKNRL